LDDQRLVCSPSSLWLYLDQLRGSPTAKYARANLAGILFFLKLSGDFYLPAKEYTPGVYLSFADERLRLIAYGVERNTPKEPKVPKLAFRYFHLEALAAMRKDEYYYRDLSLCILGMFALMRAAELADLRKKDLHYQSDGSFILSFLRKKADLDSSPTQIRIASLVGLKVPVITILRTYLTFVKNPDDRLFYSSKGKPLSASSISVILQTRLTSLNFTGVFTSHCLRVGGATFMAEQGKSESEIKSLGGWKGNTFLRYIRDIVRSFSPS